MEYWNSLLTEESWRLLQELIQRPYKFTLIGGWATYLWTRQQKSKDIDIVLDSVGDLDLLKTEGNLRKNENLRKYEIKHGEVDVDVYVPYYSRLSIPPEEIREHTTQIEGYAVADGALSGTSDAVETTMTDVVRGRGISVPDYYLRCSRDPSHEPGWRWLARSTAKL